MKARKAKKVEEAKARQEAYDKLTAHQKISLLDMKFGQGNGAAKQRARLAKKATT
jgi:hypothetical protein